MADGQEFWKRNPQGIEVAALFGPNGGQGPIGKAIRGIDVNNDGFLNKDEFRQAIDAGLKTAASEAMLKKVVAILAAVCLLVIGCIFGLTFVVMDLTKETSTDSSGVMKVKGEDKVVQVSSYEMEVDPSGGLMQRTHNGTKSTSKVVVSAETKMYAAKLSSNLPNSYFEQLKYFVLSDKAVHMNLMTFGFVRMPRMNSLYGEVVVVITQIGRITIDGETLSFTDDIGTIFHETGFQVDPTTRRRLNGFYELQAFFNSLPEDAWEGYDPATDGPVPKFPATYKASVTKMAPCDFNSTSYCPSGTPGLVDFEGAKYTVAQKTIYIDNANNKTMEVASLPSRSATYSFGEMRDFANNDYVRWQQDAAGVGYYCRHSRASPQEGNDIGAMATSGILAKYGGVTQVDGKDMREWKVYPTAKDYFMQVYDMKVASDYIPQRMTIFYDPTGNAPEIMTIYKIDSIDTNFNVAEITEPATCNEEGNGVVPKSEILFSSNSRPGADDEVVAEMERNDDAYNQWLGRDIVALPNRTADGSEDTEGYTASQGYVHGRKLSGYSCCTTSSGGATSRQYDLGVVSGELGYAPNICYVSGSIDIRAAGVFKLSGKLYADVNPQYNFNSGCWEVGGCIEAFAGIEAISLGLTLAGCLGGGRATVAGCYRGYAFLQLQACIGSSSFGGEICGSIFIKVWFPAGCNNKYHLDPYLQYDIKFPCIWGLCADWGSKAWHIFGEPGKQISN